MPRDGCSGLQQFAPGHSVISFQLPLVSLGNLVFILSLPSPGTLGASLFAKLFDCVDLLPIPAAILGWGVTPLVYCLRYLPCCHLTHKTSFFVSTAHTSLAMMALF